jgi:hypothetical protein
LYLNKSRKLRSRKLFNNQKSLKKATAPALMEVASHTFLYGYNGQQETAPKKTQSYMDYFVIFMPQKSIYAVFQK